MTTPAPASTNPLEEFLYQELRAACAAAAAGGAASATITANLDARIEMFRAANDTPEEPVGQPGDPS